MPLWSQVNLPATVILWVPAWLCADTRPICVRCRDHKESSKITLNLWTSSWNKLKTRYVRMQLICIPVLSRQVYYLVSILGLHANTLIKWQSLYKCKNLFISINVSKILSTFRKWHFFKANNFHLAKKKSAGYENLKGLLVSWLDLLKMCSSVHCAKPFCCCI